MKLCFQCFTKQIVFSHFLQLKTFLRVWHAERDHFPCTIYSGKFAFFGVMVPGKWLLIIVKIGKNYHVLSQFCCNIFGWSHSVCPNPEGVHFPGRKRGKWTLSASHTPERVHFWDKVHGKWIKICEYLRDIALKIYIKNYRGGGLVPINARKNA